MCLYNPSCASRYFACVCKDGASRARDEQILRLPFLGAEFFAQAPSDKEGTFEHAQVPTLYKARWYQETAQLGSELCEIPVHAPNFPWARLTVCQTAAVQAPVASKAKRIIMNGTISWH
jgi:hypothetical protein